MSNYARFLGFESTERVSVNGEPFQKCWVAYKGDLLLVNIFGRHNLDILGKDTIVKLTSKEVYTGRWTGWEFINAKPTNLNHKLKPMNFSVEGGFETNGLSF